MKNVINILIQKIKTTDMWLLLLIAVVASEIFTAIMNTLLGVLWFGSISYELLKIGSIDALVVPMLVAPFLISIVKFTDRMILESEQKYRALMRDAGEAILLAGRDGKIIEVNHKAAELFGHTMDELITMDIRQLHPADEVEEVTRSLADSIPSGACKLGNIHILRKDRTTVPVEIAAAFIEYGTKQVTQIMIKDVTESKRTEHELTRHRWHLESLVEDRTAELQGSEKRYRSLFENMLDGFAYCRMIYEDDRPQDFVYLDVNSAFEKLTGLENVVGRKVTEVIPGIREADPELFEIYGRVALSGKPERFEMYVKALSTWFSISVYSPQKEYFVAVFDVITERKRAEEELRSSVQMWNNTFDAMNEAVSIMDAEGTILRCNRAMLFFFDKPPDQIIGKTYWDIVHPAEGRVEDCAFSRMRETHRRESMTVRLQMHWFNIVIDPILDREGKLAGCVQIMTNVTEHRQFEDQLKESESKFRSLAEQSLVGTYIIQDGKFKYASPRMTEMFGYGVQEIMDRKGPLELVVPEDHHVVEQNMRRRLSGQIPFSYYEVRGLKKGGDIINIEIFGSAMSYQGRPAIIGAVLDITEKKKLEQQLLQAQKMEAVGQLTGGIAHDFNNILSAVIGYGYLLQMQMKEGDPLRSYVDQILASADRAANLTRSLLTFSRKQITNLKPIDINENIGRVETLLRRVIGEDINLRTALAPGDLVVNVDGGQLEQVLMNLATNARDAMPKGGILSLEAVVVEPGDIIGLPPDNGKRRKYVLISVTDTGVGMDEKTRAKIFEPFFTTKDLGRGTGLGLSMVYGIIKQHGGAITCYSEPGKGTTFKIYLPLLIAGEEKTTLKASIPALEELTGGTETILVVEDDEALRHLAKMTLEDAGYTVIEAEDGEDAVRKFRENKVGIRLVLCDVIMPGKSGGDVHEEIEKISSGTRIVFMSGYPADIIREKKLLPEGEEIILKPVPPSVLLKKIREALDKK